MTLYDVILSILLSILQFNPCGQPHTLIPHPHSRDLHTRLKLVIGIPMLSSATNAAFWLQLCHAAAHPGAPGMLADLHAQEKAAGADPHAQRVLYERINKQLVARVLEVPGVAGLHVMPLTALARRITLGMLRDGGLPAGGTVEQSAMQEEDKG